ncbi:MAG: hypothetical protein KY476_12180 [Planctomycetes bacterium]|nr:hypothetical protein [Planctomycetota bacterium]
MKEQVAEFGVIVPPQDPRLIERIVGFLEYGMALKNLTEFVNAADERELAIADGLVRQRPQFRIDTNLSRHLQGASSLNAVGRDRVAFSKHGLDWVLALARVEFGAILAAYSSHSQPFQATLPTQFETEAYREILTDGLRTHYWALKFDPAIRNYPRTGVPESHIITYGRRAGMIRQFLQAAHAFSLTLWSPQQLAELNAWDSEFRRLQLVLLYCLSQKIGAEGSANMEYAQQLNACGGLLRAAQQELGVAGTNWRADGANLGSFRLRLSDILVSLDPSLLTVPCQQTPIIGGEGGGVPVSARRRR